MDTDVPPPSQARALRQAAKKMEQDKQARVARDEAIYGAFLAHATQEQIALEVGLSKSQVGRIIAARLAVRTGKVDSKPRK